MPFIMKSLVLFVAILACALAEYKSYNGYKVYDVIPENEKHLQLLSAFKLLEEFDFWSQARVLGKNVTLMVSPEGQQSFEVIAKNNKLVHSVVINDVDKVLAEERARQAAAPKVADGTISFTEYLRYETILAYLDRLVAEYPSIVKLRDIGQSTEGRPLLLLEIGTGGTSNPGIFIEAGIHAREWIAPATTLYIIQELVENPANRILIEQTTWYVVVVTNPDGYEFSHTTDRLWRKTRTIGVVCNGVDGNRNFDYHWMLVGASQNECSEVFAGPYPFSEPETIALRDFALEYKGNIHLYLGVHSFGQYILYPWGYTAELPENAPELHALGLRVDEAIRAVAGTAYTVGSSTNVLYAAAGGSDDWMKAVGGIDLSYTLELPGGGATGFDLPASRIIPVVEETWEGIVEFQRYINEKFGTNA